MLSPSGFPLGTMGCEGCEGSSNCAAEAAPVDWSFAAEAFRPRTRFELKASENAPKTPAPDPLPTAIEGWVDRPQEPVAAVPFVVSEAFISS